MSPQVSRTVIDGYLGAGNRVSARLIETLTERERHVLARLATGQSKGEIGADLHLSVGTIKDHVSAILGKLGVSTRLQAALYCRTRRLDGRARAEGHPVRGLRWLAPFFVDVALVAVAFTDGILYLSSLAAFAPEPWSEGTPSQVSLVIGGALGLSLRRRWPWLSFLLAVPGLIVSSVSFAGMVAFYSVAVIARRLWTIVLAGVAVLTALVSPWWGLIFVEEAIVSLIYAVMTVAAPIALGLLVRIRRELTARLYELEQVRERERRHAAAEILNAERARIAREMHDVVSHQVSLIAIQTGALQVASADRDVKTTARTVRSLAVRTFDELRQMVTVLRAPPGPAPPHLPPAHHR